MRLYDIPAEFTDLLIHLDETGGELTPDLQARWEKLTLDGEAKVDATACVLRNMSATEEALAHEIARLEARKTSIGNQMKRLKSLLIPALVVLGGKVKTDRFTVYNQTQKNIALDLAPGADIWSLPVEWVRTREPELNKSVIKKALADGTPAPPEIVVSEGSTTFVVVR